MLKTANCVFELPPNPGGAADAPRPRQGPHRAKVEDGTVAEPSLLDPPRFDHDASRIGTLPPAHPYVEPSKRGGHTAGCIFSIMLEQIDHNPEMHPMILYRIPHLRHMIQLLSPIHFKDRSILRQDIPTKPGTDTGEGVGEM